MVTKKKPTKKVVKKPVPKRCVAVKVVKHKCPVARPKKCPTVCKSPKRPQPGRRGKPVGRFGESIKAAINSVKDKIDDYKTAQAQKQAAYNAPQSKKNPYGKSKQTIARENAAAAAIVKEQTERAQRKADQLKYQQDLAIYQRQQLRRNPKPRLVQPTAPVIPFRDQWKDAKTSVVEAAKRQATPQGIWNTTKTVVGGTAKVISSGMDAAIQLEKQHSDAVQTRQDARRREWEDLTPETRASLITEQAEKRKMEAQLSNMRANFRDAQLDRNEAALTGQRHTPKIFKIAASSWDGEDKFVDEYGNERTDPGTEVNARKPQPRVGERKREMDDISNLLGGSFSSSKNYKEDVARRQPQISSSSEDTGLVMSDHPRTRVHRGEFPLPEQSQQMLQPPQPVIQKNRRTAHSDEMEELNSFKNTENTVLKQLLSGY